ncbi:hypothetical protein [Nonomuraea sp. bgisy101]|uniref:hypothetical protein n=1 Tax=Nonomuraea sp. bgisy101 TaxID=3413784 RepID=UPI003D7422A7
MIVEDEFGNDIDLTALNEPEPSGEPEPEPPLDLEEIQAAYDEWAPRMLDRIGLGTRALVTYLPELVAELHAARVEIEQLRATERHEYTITDGSTPGPDAELATGEQIDAAIADRSRTGWVRTVSASPWCPFSLDPPF